MSSVSQHIAIFGCGQLAQMTAQAGLELGHRFTFIADEGEDSRCVNGLGSIFVMQKDISAEVLFEKTGNPDVISVEKEMVDASLLQELSALTKVLPNNQAIYVAQNRVREKTFLQNLQIPTADFLIIDSLAMLQSLPEKFGFPIYIKAAESGYDGYNQWRIKKSEDLSQEALIAAIQNKVELIAEKHVDYAREVSVIAARNTHGEILMYPMMENRHEDGVLIATIAPAPNPVLADSAFEIMKKLLIEMDYVGVLTMECFETVDGIAVNELAPRVHNSGHWTIEGAVTSQFENHCRAITGMELGSVEMKSMAGLVNMLGRHGDREKLETHKPELNGEIYYHAYGKEERPRRKLGHVTVCAQTSEALTESLNDIINSLYGDQYR